MFLKLYFFQVCFSDKSASEHKLHCCSVSSDCDLNTLPIPPGPPTSRPPSSRSIHPQTDFDTLSEKYWGEILERTVSSNSLQALQRSYNQNNVTTIPPNVVEQYHQLGCFQSSVIDLSNGYYNPQQMHGTLRPFQKKSSEDQAKLNQNYLQQQSRQYFQQNELINKKLVSNFSNSEPHLCEHYMHDINCAKNKL